MTLERPSNCTAMEHEQVHRYAGEAESQAVEHTDEADDLAFDSGFLAHLLHGDLGRGVPDVGPARRIEPDAGVRSLHEKHFALVVADDGRDADLRGDVAGN